jgi:hypothetical protein
MESTKIPIRLEDIPDKLSRAWELLSGEKRTFEWNDAEQGSPPFGEHCFLLSMDFLAHDTKAGVALLLSRDDALTVTGAMFGIGQPEISSQDLDDACAEVCNVMADCTAELIARREDLYTRLPQHLDANAYRQLCLDSGISQSLKSTRGGSTIYLLIFNPLTPSFETRPCPLL